MGLRMKCFNIMGLHWKIQFLGGWGGGSRNSVCWGRLLKKGAWTVYRFKGCLTKNKGIVFLRGGGWYVFGLNTGKCGSEKTLNSDTFLAVFLLYHVKASFPRYFICIQIYPGFSSIEWYVSKAYRFHSTKGSPSTF